MPTHAAGGSRSPRMRENTAAHTLCEHTSADADATVV